MSSTFTILDCATGGLSNELKALLELESINVNAHDESGSTALNLAVQYEKVEIVKILLADPRVDPNFSNNYDMTPLTNALCYNKCDILNILARDHRVDINRLTRERFTLLHYAVLWCTKVEVELLLRVPGIDVNVANYKGSSPLISAAINNFTEKAELILALGKNVDTTFTFQGKTALQHAQDRRSYNAKRLLIEYENDKVFVQWKLRHKYGTPGEFLFLFFSFFLFLTLHSPILNRNQFRQPLLLRRAGE
jgi:ankyrin repeat protein